MLLFRKPPGCNSPLAATKHPTHTPHVHNNMCDSFCGITHSRTLHRPRAGETGSDYSRRGILLAPCLPCSRCPLHGDAAFVALVFPFSASLCVCACGPRHQRPLLFRRSLRSPPVPPNPPTMLAPPSHSLTHPPLDGLCHRSLWMMTAFWVFLFGGRGRRCSDHRLVSHAVLRVSFRFLGLILSVCRHLLRKFTAVSSPPPRIPPKQASKQPPSPPTPSRTRCGCACVPPNKSTAPAFPSHVSIATQCRTTSVCGFRCLIVVARSLQCGVATHSQRTLTPTTTSTTHGRQWAALLRVKTTTTRTHLWRGFNRRASALPAAVSAKALRIPCHAADRAQAAA